MSRGRSFPIAWPETLPCLPVCTIFQIGSSKSSIPYWPIGAIIHISIQSSLSPLTTVVPFWKWCRYITVWALTKPWPFVLNHNNGWCWFPMPYEPLTTGSTMYWYRILGWFGVLIKGKQIGTKEVGIIYTLPKCFLFKRMLFSRILFPPIFRMVYEIKYAPQK